jgi:hypothetical protein
MIHGRLWANLLIALVVTLAPVRAQENKSDAEKPADPPQEPKQKIIKVEEVAGKLTKVDLKKNSITVQVTYTVPDPGAQKRIQQLSSELNSASRIGNAAARSRRMSDLQAQINQQSSKVKQEHKDVVLRTGEDMVVRLKSPPVEYDENGKHKKYTNDELKELKGPNHEWGYTADSTQLRTGQSIKVYVGKKKTDKSKDKAATDNTPFVYKIHIYSEVKK